MDEAELITRCKNRDENAFRVLIEQYKTNLASFIYRIVWDEELTQDLVQETFIKVFLNIHKFEYIARLKTWIYTIATNLSINEWRKQKRRKIFSIQHILQERGAGSFDDIGLLSHEDSPLQNVMSMEKSKYINKALQSLPPKYRIPIILFEIEQEPYEAIAEILHIPIGTVKSRIHRGRMLLKKKLQPYLDIDVQTNHEESDKAWIAAR